jgi:MoaA/NifB/PqqE/SkfB family radical SAM enzyme
MSDWQRLLWYYGAGRFFTPRPRWLCYNATYRCDSHCLHCGIWRGKYQAEELPPAELKRIFSGPFFGAVHTAWLTGGEPTLRRDLAAVVAVMIASMPSLHTLGLATHGIRTRRVVPQLVNLLDVLDPARHSLFVHVSVDGIGETHDRVRGVAGAYAGVIATLDAIAQLRCDYPAHRIEVGLNCVIQPANLADLDRLLDLARERGHSITFNLVQLSEQYFANLAAETLLRFAPEQVELVTRFLHRLATESPPALGDHYRQVAQVLHGEPRRRRCLTPWSTINLDADGTYLTCPTATYLFPVNVLGRDPEEVWQSREVDALRRRIQVEYCPTCPLSCSLGDSLTLSEWWRGGWEK